MSIHSLRYSFLTLLLFRAGLASAQSEVTPVPMGKRVVSVSPVELIYKTQVGYEHRWQARNSLGVLGSYHYGHFASTNQLQGGQLTGYYRRFLTQEFPAGLYVQAQVSLLDFVQPANLVDIKTKLPYTFDYSAVSAGIGAGFGYRSRILQRTFGGHLLYNALLGIRYQHRAKANYDAAIYRPENGFLGETDDANWHLGFGPGSLVQGLLTLDYQF